jgi:spore maturation protein SpmA
MALNYIFVGFFLIAFAVAFLKFILTGDVQTFKEVTEGMLKMAEVAVMDIALPLTGVMTFFLGMLNVGEKAGIINRLAKIIGPFFNKLFPEVPKDHPANGQMIMNFSANFLGLDNAATPFGSQSHAKFAGTEPEQRHCFQCADHVSGAAHLGFADHSFVNYRSKGDFGCRKSF